MNRNIWKFSVLVYVKWPNDTVWGRMKMSVCGVAISSNIETSYSAGKFFKTDSKWLKIISGSPWNWQDSLDPLHARVCNKSWESPSEKQSQAAKKVLNLVKLQRRLWDPTSCLEEAESSQGAWKRVRATEKPENATGTLQPAELPVRCAV